MRRLSLPLLAGVVAIGCADPRGLIPGFQVPAAPPASQGFQIVLDPVKDLQPATDYEYCTWTDKIFDQDVKLKTMQGYQSLGGHHVILFTTSVQQPPGTSRICKDADMATFRFSVASGGEGLKNQAPGDLYFPVPAGSQVVINHHYINAGTQTIPEAQSAINAYFADPTTDTTPTGSLVMLDTNLNIPPGPSTLDVSCTLQQDFNAWYLIPHMHAYGSSITIENTRAGQTTSLFNTQWDPSFAFHPPAMSLDPTTPYAFKKGDQVHVQCNWDNTTGNTINFGVEMCVMFAATVDTTGQGNVLCDTASNPPWGTF